MADSESKNSRARWFCQIEGKEVGPLNDKQLRQLAKDGQLRPTDSIKKDSAGKWVHAEKVKGLFPATAPLKQPSVSSIATDPTPRDSHNDAGKANAAPPERSADDLLASSTDITASSPTLASTKMQDTAKVDVSDTTTDPLNLEASDFPTSSANPYQPALLQQPESPVPASAPAAQEEATAKRSLGLWIAIGSATGGIAVLFVVGMLAMWMLQSDSVEVAASPEADEAPATSSTANSSSTVNDQATTDQQLEEDTAAQSPSPDDAISDTANNSSVPPMSTEGGSIVRSSTSLPDTPASENTEAANESADATLPMDGDEDPAAESQSVVAGQPKAEVETAQTPAEASLDGKIDDQSPPTSSIGFGTVAPESPAKEIPSTSSNERSAKEAAEAKAMAAEIDSLVKQRIDQAAQRSGLAEKMNTNREQYANAMNAIRVATNDLPRMQKQFQVLKDSHREALAIARSTKLRSNATASVQTLEREIQVLQNQITQVIATGNAAVRAKPNLENEWKQQNTHLTDLQNREGEAHEKLMNAIDPFGHQSKQHRTVLLERGSNWDATCVEACLIRGFTELYDGRLRPALDDFSIVISKLEASLKDKRAPKDSPERRILQAAFTGRGLAQFRDNKEPEAIKDLSKATAVSNHYTFPSVIRGMVEVERKRDDAAMRDFEAARRLGDAHASREAARLLLTSSSMANPKRALTFAEEATSKETSWINHEVHAMALAANQQSQQAREAYEKAIELAPVDQLERLEEAVVKLP